MILIQQKLCFNLGIYLYEEILGDALIEVMEPIEALAYSPEEFENERNKQGGFLNHVLQQAETTNMRL
ncbi:hypothetical protein [Desulfosporosinus hippei]|uniref:hypothetical protein n=1 Tax=Desulfosporosinus hippei TaxID=569859 RepID=UPI000B81B8C7|nr:hypothetical protein [Desulfosporosinus hippei]